MSELEKKFYEYFDKNYKLGGHKYSKLLKKQIKDLAKIAKKDYAEKEKEYLEEIKGRDGIINKVIDKRDELQKENERLRNAIREYLDKNIATDEKLEELQHKVRKAIGQDENLIKENAELKKQIENRKYLNRGEMDDFVKEIITITLSNYGDESGEPIEDLPMQVWEDFEEDFNRIITTICSLVIPITKEKIIEVLEKYQIREIEKFTPQNKGKERCVWEREPEQIASEILGDEDENK